MNRKWVVASRPEVEVQAHNFELKQEPVPVVPPGAVLVKDPLPCGQPTGPHGLGFWRHRWPAPSPSAPPCAAAAWGRWWSPATRTSPPGDLVAGELGWQQYAVSDGARRRPVRKVQGRSGLADSTLAARHGQWRRHRLLRHDGLLPAAPWRHLGGVRRRRQRLACSSASLAACRGCRVVGIAGSRGKCDWLVHELGCAAAIDYKAEDVGERLDQTCPDGIDIYFDNVGGATLDAALARIARAPGVGAVRWHLPIQQRFGLVRPQELLQFGL